MPTNSNQLVPVRTGLLSGVRQPVIFGFRTADSSIVEPTTPTRLVSAASSPIIATSMIAGGPITLTAVGNALKFSDLGCWQFFALIST